MTLPVNFLVYGQVRRENGVYINGATVTATDLTNAQGTAGTTANQYGKYIINIKNVASDGDTISVSCTFQRESRTLTFVLDVADGTKEINLDLRLIQIITKGHGAGPAVYIRCLYCGYNNYYPKPCNSYCCHACQFVMNEKGETGSC